MATTRDAIVDAALLRAEQTSWEAVRLHDVATVLGVTLDDIRAHFREKEEIVDAWLDRADSAMLKDAGTEEFRQLPLRQRLERAIMTWLGALARHRRVTRQMVWNRFEPGHLHYQLNGLFRVSRTVQWMREAAGCDARLPWRAIEETALTSIYLGTFFYWLRDDSQDAVRTRTYLAEKLASAERMARALPGFGRWDETQAPRGGPSGPNEINL
jgi:ubiquinone biosynthesis protein COQ9